MKEVPFDQSLPCLLDPFQLIFRAKLLRYIFQDVGGLPIECATSYRLSALLAGPLHRVLPPRSSFPFAQKPEPSEPTVDR